MRPFYRSSIVVVLLLLFICANCKKKKKEIQHQYPEDPGTTTQTPRERLDASWKIYSYQFKNQEIIQYLDTFDRARAKIEDVSINYTYRPDYEQWLFLVSNKYFNFQSETAFNIEDPYYISFSGGANVLFSRWFITPFKWAPANSTLTTKWTITKLYGTDLNLVLNTDSGEYKMFLKKLN